MAKKTVNCSQLVDALKDVLRRLVSPTELNDGSPKPPYVRICDEAAAELIAIAMEEAGVPLQSWEDEIEVCAHRVSYRYWDIPLWVDLEYGATKEGLEREAASRAKECITEGYVSGELNYLAPDGNTEIRGLWKIKRD